MIRVRQRIDDLIHHNARRVQRVSIRYTEYLAEAGIEPLVENAGGSFENALAWTISGRSRRT